MTIKSNVVKALAVLGLIGCASVYAQLRAIQQIDPAVAKLGREFVSSTERVNGTTLHYVRGGTGPVVILLHGFPEDWYEFHQIMPRLAKKFTVVAVDLRGMGGSAATPDGYDASNMAEDIHQLAEHLRLEHLYVVGHDLGGMVAYASARRYTRTMRGVMILDVPLAGIGAWEEINTLPQVWHIRFHQTPDLPEQLIAGRQAIYFRHFLSSSHFSDADIARYANSYAAPENLRAIFEFYRAFPADERFNAAQQSPIDLPIILAAGESSPFNKFIPRIAEALRAHGCANVKTEVIHGSSHYVADEQPDTVAELIEGYASL